MSESDELDVGSEHDVPDRPAEINGNPTVADKPRTKPRRRRWWLAIVAGVLVLVVAGAAIYWQLRPKASAAAPDQYVAVSQQTLKQTVSATGTIDPAQQSELSFASSGTVTGVDVEVGDKVSKGEKLATMDDSSLKATVDSDKAALQASRDNLSTLKDNSDSTATALASARADVTLKKSELAQAKSALQGATLTAPFDGVVAAVGISVGDAAGGSGSGSSGSGSSESGSSGSSGGSGSFGSGGSTSSSSSPSSSDSGSITVISTNAWTVSTSVGGSDLSSVKKGLQAQITPSGATDPVFGTVETVGVIASSSDSGSSSFPVTIKVTGSPSGLHDGESANVSIIVKQLSNALVVPTLAVKTVNGQAVVDKKSGNTTVQTKITIGDTYGFYTEVTSGLKAGDQVKISVPARGAGGGAGTGAGGAGAAGGRTGGGFGGAGGFGGGGRFGGGGGGFGGGAGGFGGGGFGGGRGGFGGGQGGGR